MSSAKSLTLDLTCSGRSFMYTRKKIEPRREPCGNMSGILGGSWAGMVGWHQSQAILAMNSGQGTLNLWGFWG